MKIRWPEAKFHGESASDVQKSLAPQKLGKTCKKLINMQTISFSLFSLSFFFLFFRAGSRCGDFFVREVGVAIFSSSSVRNPYSRVDVRAGDGRTDRRVDAVSAKRLPGGGPGGSIHPGWGKVLGGAVTGPGSSLP